jgi:Tfp pilus assembly protein PilF
VHAALRLKPEDAPNLYYVTLGRAYFLLGDLEQARINLEHALGRGPTHLEARIYLAALHATAGDTEAATWEVEEIRLLCTPSSPSTDGWRPTP